MWEQNFSYNFIYILKKHTQLESIQTTNIPYQFNEVFFFFCSSTLLLIHIHTHFFHPNFNLATDEHALLFFKNSVTLDPHAILSSNWSSNIFICNWTGVSCGVKHRRVTALNLSGFHLAGTISPHLSNLTFLQSLDISSNAFTGSMPSELSKLRRLKELNAAFNSFSTEIPSWLGHLSQLRHLHLNNNTFSGTIPSSLFNISRLQTLDMSYNFLEGNLPNEIANFSYLERLNLAGNKITGPIPNGVFNMSSLIEVNLTSNMIFGELSNDIFICSDKLKRIYISVNHLYGEIPANIYECREVEDMRLSMNNFSGNVPRGIGSLPMLKILYLWSNHFQGGIPEEIGNLTSLHQLDFCDNNMTGVLPQEVGNLVHLEYLNVRHNSLSGSIPSSIFNVSALKFLDLAMNQLSGNIPSNNGNIRFSPSNLEVLHLLGNKLSGEIPSFITNNASKLTFLSLQNNSLSGPIPNFGNLRLLQKLYISGNQLTGAESPSHEMTFFSSLISCRYLENLEISYNPVNGILPTSLGNLSTSLQYFAASGCNIQGVIPSEIGNLTSLIDLRLDINKITGPVPRRMWNLRKLQGLNLSNNYLEGGISIDLCLMSNLETLGLSGNNFTGPIPNCLGEVQSLRHVYLALNKLDSPIPSNLWNLRDLLTLNLSSNYLTGQLPSQIGNLKQIYQLDLSYNHLLGDIPTIIDSCQSLEFISLSNNKLQGSIPKSLGSVRGLTTLDLSSNNLSGFIPKSLEGLHFLRYFNVSYNNLEGEIPRGIANSTAQSFVHNSALCGAPEFQVLPCVIDHGRPRSKTIAMIFLKYIVPLFVATTFCVVVVLVLIRRRKKIIIRPGSDISIPCNLVWRRISYIQLVRGTTSFNEENLLGIGTFGSVYKATLPDGLNIAVKVFNLELEGATKSFDTESEILSTIRHRNLLPVIGCCTNKEFRALILKYMPNGSLEKWLHSDGHFLDVVQRLNISLDVALALEYLHHGHPFPVVHCDIKPDNVLLDQDMTARVADFGISKLFDDGEALTHTTTLATVGYAAPEYGSEGKVSTNGDVYSFGILVLEMFTEKKPTDDMFNEEMSLKDWVNQALRGNAISKIMAPGLVSRKDEHDLCRNEECVLSIFDMAMKCFAFSPHKRIDMKQIVAHLHKIKEKVNNKHSN